MRARWIVFLFLFFTLFGCPKQHPPIEPPGPVPCTTWCDSLDKAIPCEADCPGTEIKCGDGKCDDSEKGKCEVDCGKEPPPPPVPEKPKSKIVPGVTRVVTLGNYGLFNSVDADPWEVAKAIYDTLEVENDGEYISGYTGVYTAINMPWCQVPGKELYPWPNVGKTFYMDKDNEAYYERLEEWAAAFEWYSLDFFIWFDDVYFLSKWASHSWMRSKIHPYRTNNIGVNWGDCDACLYDGIQFHGGENFTFTWLKWKVIAEPRNVFQFTCDTPMCRAQERWRSRVVKVLAAKFKESKTWRIGYKRANEEYSYSTADGHGDRGKSLGDRSEIYAWLYELWKKGGLTPDNKRIFVFVNRTARGPADHPEWRYRDLKVIHDDNTDAYGDQFGLGAIHEIHIDGVRATNPKADPVQTRENLIKFAGFKPEKTFWSTDGMPKISGKQYTDDNRELWLTGDPYIDILWEEALWPEAMSAPYKVGENFRKFFKYHLKMVQ